MLPPESSATAGPSPPTLPASSAATPTAPAPSTTSFVRSSRSTIASLISSSVTVDEVVEQLVEDRHRQLAGLLDRDPVGDRVAVDAPRRTPTSRTLGLNCAQRERDPGARGRRRRPG